MPSTKESYKDDKEYSLYLKKLQITQINMYLKYIIRHSLNSKIRAWQV